MAFTSSINDQNLMKLRYFCKTKSSSLCLGKHKHLSRPVLFKKKTLYKEKVLFLCMFSDSVRLPTYFGTPCRFKALITTPFTPERDIYKYV